MNEQLKKLVEEAGGEFWQRLENDVVIKDAYVTFDPPEALENLTELIVRKCATICEHRKLTPSAFVADELLEHFGIKK